MPEPTITFTTAFIDLNEDRSKDKSPEVRIKHFKTLAKSGIAICIYVSSTYENIGKELENEFKNVKLMPIINLEKLETYKIIKKLNPELPINRNNEKDTLNYMILQNAKTEFVYKTVISNPFNTEHFAWIDFSICHILTDTEIILKQLYNYSISSFTIDNNLSNDNNLGINNNFLLFPTCFSKEKSQTYFNILTSHIVWRFCGGFFIGNKSGLEHMYFLMLKELPHFIKHTNKNSIAWEVNVWSWLELKCGWTINSYQADHNNSILTLPQYYFNFTLEDKMVNCIKANNTHNLKNIINKYVDKVIYVNLESRTDRKAEIENELNNFNIDYERFNAISRPDYGIIGCTQSHLEVIKMAKNKRYKNILILEDDFTFTVSKDTFEKQIELLFNSNVNFDICMLSYNLIKYKKSDEYTFLHNVLDAQTTSGYIINENMYDIMIDLYTWTIPLLDSTRHHWTYSLDQIWKLLQPIMNWYCFSERLGKQSISYSDLHNDLLKPNY
jgi:glycosyl transferase family 25